MDEPDGAFQITILCHHCGAPMLFDADDDGPAIQSQNYAELSLACVKCNNRGVMQLTAVAGERMQ